MLVAPTLLNQCLGNETCKANYMLEVKGSFGSKDLMQNRRFQVGRELRMSLVPPAVWHGFNTGFALCCSGWRSGAMWTA